MRRARLLRWAGFLLASLVAVLLAGAVALSLWLRPAPMARGPLAYGDAVLQPAGPAAVPGRERRSLTMTAIGQGSDLPPLAALVERPCSSNGPAAALLLLGGLRTGAKALDHVDFPGQVVLAALDYPYDHEAWEDAGALARAKMAADMVPIAAEQSAALLRWLGGAPGVDPDRVVFAGVSLGAILGPAVLARAQDAGSPVAASALAYGGANLTLLLEELLSERIEPAPLRHGAARWAAWIFEDFAPERHLPAVEGRLLLVEADADDLLPAASLAAMREAAPAGTEVRVQQGAHIKGSSREIVEQTVATIRSWLIDIGLLDPRELVAQADCRAD